MYDAATINEQNLSTKFVAHLKPSYKCEFFHLAVMICGETFPMRRNEHNLIG
jgi:hypothetical protein